MSTPYKLGVKGPDPNKERFSLYRPSITSHQLPEDYSFEYLMAPIWDQAQSPECVAFGVSAMFNAMIFKRTKTRVPISQRALYSMAKYYGEPNDLASPGTYAQYALEVLETEGYVTLTDWPFGNPVDENDPEIYAEVPSNLVKKDHLINNFLRINPDIESLQLALFEHGPVAVSFDFQNSWFTPNSDGTVPAPDRSAGGHEMCMVGYSKVKQAFRIRNSWGTSYGDAGYIWIPFDYMHLMWDAYTIGV